MQSQLQHKTAHKNRDLVLGILFDVIGTISFAIPLVGEFTDVIWAPVAGFLMTWMYKGKAGKVAGVETGRDRQSSLGTQLCRPSESSLR